MINSTVTDQTYLPLIVAFVVAVIELVAGLLWGDFSADTMPRRFYATVATGVVLSGSVLAFLFTQNTLAQTTQALTEMKVGSHFTTIAFLVILVSLIAHVIVPIAGLVLVVREHWYDIIRSVREYLRKFRLRAV